MQEKLEQLELQLRKQSATTASSGSRFGDYVKLKTENQELKKKVDHYKKQLKGRR